ncbi:MAG TPA: M64 family metallopeptidase [Opitutaceae bacterium]|nr:M64 family metallopeptidase [Opitutaceae bacterium]
MPLTVAPYFLSPHDQDLHLLRGQPAPDLQELLQVEWRDPDNPDDTDWGTFDEYPQPEAGPDVVLDFKPVFRCTTTATEYSGFGVTIVRTTGEMTIDPWPANQHAPANFIVEVSVVQNGTVHNPPLDKALIRVHLHNSVKRVWMTPKRLSIRRPRATGDVETGYAFTIRAQFDDDSVGDITESDNYFSADGEEDFFGEGNRIQIPDAMRAGAVRTTGITTIADWGSLTAHADIAVLEPFATATDLPKISLVDGRAGEWDGTQRPESAPNVLLLGAGFRALDLGAWEALTNQIVHHLRSDTRLNPYPYFSQSMNYWRALSPAGDPGVCVRCEVYPVEDDGRLYAVPVPAPERPKPGKSWTVENLIFMAGLPVLTDQALVKPDATDPDIPDYSDLNQKFNEIVDPSIPRLLTPDIVGDWLKLAKRTFVDEVDNFPSMAIGEPPSAVFDDTGLIHYHPLRVATIGNGGDGGERVDFFSHLQGAPRSGFVNTLDDHAPDSNFLGNLWAADRSYFTFDNRRFLITVANLAPGPSVFFGRSLHNDDFGMVTRPAADVRDPHFELGGLSVTTDPTRNALVQTPPALADLEIDMETWDVIAHEMGHAFDLGDEYGDEPTSFTGTADAFDDDANLMAYSAAIKADQSTPDPRIIVDQLKWTWPRVRKASVMTRPVEEMFDGHGSFRVFVGKGRGFQFAAGDQVRFRVRNPRGPLVPNPVTSIVEFTVVSTHAENLTTPSDPFSMTIVVKNESIGINVAPFVAGSIIFIPVPAPNPTLSRPYLTLVPPVSERIMEKIGGAMSGTACDVNAKKINRARVQIPRMNLIELIQLAPTLRIPELVGAYYGGSQHACGVIHPAGSCVMRTGRNDWAQFCPVCQYALVEKLDPEQHWRVDRHLAPLYDL